MRARCVCGCGRRAAQLHHVIYQQELRRIARAAGTSARALIADPRNLVPVAFDCHGQHHAAARRLELWRLPDSVFEFAREVLGAGRAYEWLRRRYAGADPRLDALVA